MLMVDSERNSDLQAQVSGSILRFCKMQGLGNDFVMVAEDELERALLAVGRDREEISQQDFMAGLAVKICSRRFGVGADGLIVVRRGSKPEYLSWTYLNSDGSVSLMCGNGLRCLALWSVLNGWAPSKRFYVETGKGLVEMVFESAESITSDLGEPILQPALIPVAETEKTPLIASEFQLDSERFNISCVSMGNPHCVVFVDEFDEWALEKRAHKLQTHAFFTEGVNVEFVKVISKNHVKVIVYERGCGRTLACASGAAAVVVASVLEGRCTNAVRVELEGGSLHVEFSEKDKHVRITGPASVVYNGQLDLSALIPEAAKC